jgi:uncharacterized protein with PQ loop repeat
VPSDYDHKAPNQSADRSRGQHPGNARVPAQVVKTWRTRSAKDFSLLTLLLLEAGVSLWIFYGVWRDAPAIWLANGVTLALVGFILTVKIGVC